MARKITKAISMFKGINRFRNVADLDAAYALDCLNVICSRSGALEKMRLPVNLTPAIAGFGQGPRSFYNFQQPSGTRQILAGFGQNLYYFDINAGYASTLIDTAADNDHLYTFTTSNNIGFLANGFRMLKWTGTLLQRWGIVKPGAAPVLGAIAAPGAGGDTATTVSGWRYRVAFKNSVTGHEGSMSDASGNTGPFVAKQVNVVGPDAALAGDTQIDTYVWYRTLDGGSDYFLLRETPVVAGTAIIDFTDDSVLSTNIRGSLINDPPPLGYFLARWQGRIFIGNLQGNPQDVAYSGYERILRGRPEESFPRNNRLRLALGADAINGLGVVQAGIVAFSRSNEMYMLRGTVEDVTVDAPIAFTAFLEQLPWGLGSLNHLTIDSSDQGMVWVAPDLTIRVFDGVGQPLDISESVAPIMRSMTPGAAPAMRGGCFGWADRQWYILCLPTNGSGINNKMIFIDLETAVQLNSGIFVSDIQADDVGVIEDAQGVRHLCISQNGIIKELLVKSDTANGVTEVITSTGGIMNAYYDGAYLGNDTPNIVKQFRHAALVTDQDGFKLTAKIVNHDFTDVIRVPLPKIDRARWGINLKGRRVGILIQFPQEDVSCNVQQLTVSGIGVADR